MNRRRLLLVTAAVPAAGILGRSGPAGAAPLPGPPLVVAVEPVESGSVAYAPLAPPSAGEPEQGKLVVRLQIVNVGTTTLKINTIRFSFPGTMLPSRDMAGIDLLFNIDVDNDTVPDGPEFQPGQGKWWSNGTIQFAPQNVVKNQIYLPLPIPDTVRVELFCDGYANPYRLTLPLTRYTVSHRPPIDAADLRPGECLRALGDHWANGGAAGTQIYAHDVSVVGWDRARQEWTALLPGKDGTANEHYRGWNVPIRAAADGTVVSVDDGMADNTVLGKLPKPTPTPAGGNMVWLSHPDGTRTVYTHMRYGTITVRTGDSVTAGQILGRLGNSGNTEGPHIHLEVAKDDGALRNPLRPVLFRDAWLLEQKDGEAWDPDSNRWVPALNRGLPPTWMLIWPSGWHPTWYPRGKAELVIPGINRTDFDVELQRATEPGYRPVWIDAHELDGEVFFNLIMRPEDGLPSVVRTGMDAVAYQAQYDLMRLEGLRLINVTSYLERGMVRYAAIWRKQGGPELRAYHGLSGTAHQIRYASLVGSGYRPVNLSVVAPADNLQFTGLYVKQDVGTFTASTFLDADEYQYAWNTNVRAGRHLTYLNAYQYAGGFRFSAIFQQFAAGSGATVGQHQLDAGELAVSLEKQAQAGMLTRVLAGYARDRVANYGVGWRRP